jgi:hypothetical protein
MSSDKQEPCVSLYFDIESSQLPIVYRKEYNVKFFGFEKLHPFDACKWANIFQVKKIAGNSSLN